MATIATYIASIRARGIGVADIADADLTLLIAEALKKMSRYRPLIADRTFETVADQQTYTPTQMGDAAIRDVTYCIWNPYETGDEWTLARTLATLGVPRDVGDFHLPSQDMLEQIKSAVWAEKYTGSGYQISQDGGDLYLTPLPDSSGITVYIQYTKGYATVADVPSADEDLFTDCIEWMGCDRVGIELATKTAAIRVRTPEYERSVGEQIGVWRARAREKRAEFVNACQYGRSAVARS